MFVSHDELLWMLRQIYGQRFRQEELVRRFRNRGISSLLPYCAGIESLYNKLEDKTEVVNKAVRALAARINRDIDSEAQYPSLICKLLCCQTLFKPSVMKILLY